MTDEDSERLVIAAESVADSFDRFVKVLEGAFKIIADKIAEEDRNKRSRPSGGR